LLKRVINEKGSGSFGSEVCLDRDRTSWARAVLGGTQRDETGCLPAGLMRGKMRKKLSILSTGKRAKQEKVGEGKEVVVFLTKAN